MSRDSLPHVSIPVYRAATVEDLEHLPQVKALLSALNDPYVGVGTLAMLVDAIPLLRARCQHDAFMVRPSWRVDHSELVLGVIGNKGLEKNLLAVLEDLTVLKAGLEELNALSESAPAETDAAAPGTGPTRR